MTHLILEAVIITTLKRRKWRCLPNEPDHIVSKPRRAAWLWRRTLCPSPRESSDREFREAPRCSQRQVVGSLGSSCLAGSQTPEAGVRSPFLKPQGAVAGRGETQRVFEFSTMLQAWEREGAFQAEFQRRTLGPAPLVITPPKYPCRRKG